jgi:hypothetical protein
MSARTRSRALLFRRVQGALLDQEPLAFVAWLAAESSPVAIVNAGERDRAVSG